MSPKAARYCKRGHDTWEVGRNSSRTCRACARDAAMATHRAQEAVRGVDQAAYRKREQERQERERKRWRASLRGPKLLDQLQREAQEELRCPETISEDPPKVCGRKVPTREAGITRFFCNEHEFWTAEEAH
jgi:hypothetical protein